MRQFKVHNVIEYIKVLNQLNLSSKTMIYRGQANSNWDIDSSAYRELGKSGSVTPTILNNYHSRLIDGVRRLHDTSISNEDDITILSQLQHNKAKTILIDYTYNPLAALWFACTDKTCDKNDGCVYAIEESFTQNIFPLKSTSLDSLFKSTEITYVYHPNQINQRIINQQSVFLIRWLGKIDKTQQIQILIPKEKKQNIIQALKVLGVSRRTLFQDFIGYIDTFGFDTDNKSICSGLVIQAREIIESQKPNYSDAKSLLKKALELAKAYKGQEDIAYILHELGYISYRTNAFDEAISLYDEAITEKKKYLKADSFDVVYSEVAKGLVYLKTGDYKNALPLFKKASDKHIKSAEKYPSFIADVLDYIANIYREMGVYGTAKTMAEKAEEIALIYLGDESKNFAYIENCVGSVYAKIGKEKDALEKFETALRIFRQNDPSENNLDVVYTYLKIASLYETDSTIKKQDCLEQAIKIIDNMPKESLSAKRASAHANTIKAMYCNMTGDYDESIKLCKSVTELSQNSGKNHPKMIDTFIIYGDALFFKKRYNEALEFYQKAYDELFAINEKHPSIVSCKKKIKNCKTKI